MTYYVNNKHGYTLMELIMTLIILGLLLSIAAPKAADIKDTWVLDAITKQIVDDMRWTQNIAVSQSIGHGFELNIGEKFYRIRSEELGSPALKTRKINPIITEIECNFNDYGNYKRIIFTSTGIPSKTGTISLRTKKGKERKITVAVATGRVAIIK